MPLPVGAMRLTETGDILFYGCNLASSGNGHSLLNSIAHLTGADVAASDDNTGHAVFDADWDLEFTTGKIETPVNLSQELQDNWGHLLNVAVDATSTGTSTGGDFSVSHTTSGTDRLMLVGVSMNLGGSQTVSSVTYNGDSLSLVGVKEAGDARIEIWALLAPDVGTFNVDIAFSSPTDGNTAGVMTFTGVDQSTPLGAFASDFGYGESTASATVSSAADELVFGVVSIDDPNFRVLTEGAGQTERWELDGFQTTGGGSTAPGAPSVNMSWTWAPSDNWAAGGVSIKPSVSNTIPIVTTGAGTTPYTEQAAATVIDAGITLVDPDGYDGVDPSDQYTAVIRITGNYEAADTLGFTDTIKIQGALAGDTLNLSVIGGQTASVAEFQAALRSVTFYNGSDTPGTLDRTISFTFDDGVDSSNIATKVVPVAAVNDKPVLLTGSVNNLTVNEDAGLTSLGLASVTYGPGGGSDESGQTLTYEVTVIPDPGVGYVFLADGTTQVILNSYTLAQIQGMQFAPAPNATGTTGFQYNITDSGGTANGGIDSISQFIMITVNPVNDAPVIATVPPDVTFVEGGMPQVIDRLGTVVDVDSPDFDGGVLTVSITQNARADDRLAVHNFGTEPGEVGVSGSNVTYGGTIVGTFSGGTSGSDPLIVTFNSDATQPAVQEVRANIQFYNISGTPSTLPRQITFELTDGDGGTAVPEAKIVYVQATNDTPVFDSTAITSATEDVAYSYAIAASDVDGDSLTISATTLPAWLVLTDNGDGTATLSGTPTNAEVGDHAVVLAVSDGSLTATQSFTISVGNTNDAPTGSVTIDDTTPVEGQTLTAANTLADVDGMGAITYTWKADGIVVGTGATYTTTAGDVGRVITVEAAYTDGNGTLELVASAPTAAVSNVDQLASITGDTTYNGNEGDSAIGDLDATDADGLTDGTYFSISAQGTRGTASIDVATGAWNYVPADADWYGSDSFIVTVTDDLGGTTTQTITITLNNVNDEPIARPDGVHLFFDGDDFIRIADDPSLQMTNNLTMEAWINHNGGGTGSQLILNKEGEYELGITADTGEIIYAIAETTNTWNWHSTGHFVTAGEWTQVAVTFDGVAGQIHTYINGILVDTDNQPGPMGDVYTMYNDLSIGGRENATDQRFQGQIDEVRVWNTTLSQGEIQAHMNSLLTGGEAGLAGYWRLDEAGTGSILDLSGNGNDGVLGGSEGASATPAYQGYVTDEDTSLAIAAVSGVLANDSDPDGDPLTVAAINGSAANIGSTVALASGALVRLNADGSLSYDPNGQFEYLTQGETVTDTFTYVASDGGSDSNSTTVTITITGVNDAPLGTDDSFTVAEGATTTLNLITNDNDVDDGLDGTSIAIVSGPAHGSLVINGDGSVDYSHDGSENFTDSFTYTIDDLFGASSNNVTVGLTITPQNDAPVNTIPGTVTVDEDTPASIAGISISDNDAAGGDLTTRLMVSNGTLDVTLAGSATISAGANGSSDLTIQGTIADINASLASLTYTGNLNLSGIAADSLVVRTGDGGNTGAGGVQQDTDTIQLDINSINDAPTISTIADQTIAEDSSTGALAFTVNDVDAAGSLTVSATSSDTALIPDANLNLVDLGGGSWTVEVTPTANRSGGPVMITVTVDDGTTTANETFAVTVNSVDDDPVAVDDGITVDAGATATTLDSGAVSLLVNDSDGDLPADTLSVALAVGPAHGSLILNADGTFIYTHDGSTHFADVFTYVVRDADGGATDTGTVTVHVNPPANATPLPTTETNLAEPSEPPDQEPQPAPEPEPELPPEEILPVDVELPPREELTASTISSPKPPVMTPLQWADPTYFVPTISHVDNRQRVGDRRRFTIGRGQHCQIPAAGAGI